MVGQGKGGVMVDMDGSFTRTGAKCVVLVNVCNVYIYSTKVPRTITIHPRGGNMQMGIYLVSIIPLLFVNAYNYTTNTRQPSPSPLVSASGVLWEKRKAPRHKCHPA